MTCSSFYVAFTSELLIGRNNFIYDFVSSNGDSRGRSKAKFFRDFLALKKRKFSQICVAVAFMLFRFVAMKIWAYHVLFIWVFIV